MLAEQASIALHGFAATPNSGLSIHPAEPAPDGGSTRRVCRRPDGGTPSLSPDEKQPRTARGLGQASHTTSGSRRRHHPNKILSTQHDEQYPTPIRNTINRPLLPYAISSVAVSELHLEDFDSREFSLTIAGLLDRFDRLDSTAIAVAAPGYTPVSARAHVNRSRRSPMLSRLLASA